MPAHKGTKTIETPRLILRKARLADADAMFRNWASDPTVTRFMTWPTYENKETADMILSQWTAAYANPAFYQWAIELKDLGQPIGSISVVFHNEKTGSVLETIAALLNGGGGLVIRESGEDLQRSVAMFSKGNFLTYFASSATAPAAFNDLPFDYGFLPLPKYDEKQENYGTLSWMPNVLITNTADIDKSGLVTEWMSYYGHTLVRPEFYDSLFSARFAQDEDSTKMLDIIFGNLVFDPGMNFKSSNFYGYFDEMVIKNNTDFTSYFAGRKESEEAYIQSLNEAFANFGK